VVHAPRAVLDELGVEPWDDVPAWIPDGIGFTGMVTANTEALQEAFGFRARPLVETMAWVYEWTGLARDVEQRILAAC
jgi:hypothetical protein